MVEVVVVSEFNPQNWLAGWLAGSIVRAAQRSADDEYDECEYRNQSTNPSTLPRKSYHSGWCVCVRERADDEYEYLDR